MVSVSRDGSAVSRSCGPVKPWRQVSENAAGQLPFHTAEWRACWQCWLPVSPLCVSYPEAADKQAYTVRSG